MFYIEYIVYICLCKFIVIKFFCEWIYGLDINKIYSYWMYFGGGGGCINIFL